MDRRVLDWWYNDLDDNQAFNVWCSSHGDSCQTCPYKNKFSEIEDCYVKFVKDYRR